MPSKKQKPSRKRADQTVVDQGLAPSQSKARALILAGQVLHEERLVEKAGQMLAESAVLRLREQPRFVGRGGDKLEGAISAFSLDVQGMVLLDAGASTGGFTDCVLQHGAAKVYAVDVGRGQIAERLRTDPHVTTMERVNVRHPFELPEQVDAATIDVSFISLTLVLPEVVRHVKAGGWVLALVKPQFEAGKERVGRKGVVSDPNVHADVIAKIARWVIDEPGLQLRGIRRSVLEGDEGNREFFILMEVRAPKQVGG